ncbi:hypothetical protein EJ08DRAFT_646468 [Tothia fuscella]|uniref:Uncharacterized protein n=1 Tax=Tothia fuscella TaxID=1048955 RepID=A0A9P4NZJ8_9PEZI|nr:hypothetical protein EJ08DRAFT_646468 [Tothia fuscella]
MASRYLSASKLAFFALLAGITFADDNPCVAYGIDFQDGGKYFQNSLSNESFTFVSQFHGCQADKASNVFVDPKGEQVECSETNLTPDDTDALSTCPRVKSGLTSGDWSILILSNNGKGEPLALQRDFELSVGPQLTTTFTPSVVVPITYTPVVNATVTETDTAKTTLPPLTVTVPSTTVSPTTTVTPARVTVYSTKTLFTVKRTKPTASVVKTTKVVTASCKIPKKPTTTMKTCTIRPTVGKIQSLPTALPSGPKFRRAVYDPNNKAKFVAERRAYLAAANALVKRAPDEPTVTITDTNTANYPTVTSTETASASTATITSTSQITATITPSPVTLVNGKTTISKITITAPTPTRNIVKYTVATDYTTKTFTYTVTITSKTTPAAVATDCKKHGGVLV